MTFAAPIPLWAVASLSGALIALAVLSYRRPLVPLTTLQRTLLIAVRAASLLAILMFVCRPIVYLPAPLGDITVPIVLDVSRSMRIADGTPGPSGVSRLRRAVEIVESQLLPSLSQRYTPVLFTAGDTTALVAAGALGRAEPVGGRSDLDAALATVRARYRGGRIPGIVLLSDGGETTARMPDDEEGGGPPVFAIGVGETAGLRDREVVSVSAGEPRIDQAAVDLHVTTTSSGYGREPYEVRVQSNGRVIAQRRITPAADGAPADETFTVVPDASVATPFTVDVAGASEDAIPENNGRDTLVNPPGRRRRLLVLEGAPGFEHSFMLRALAQDPGLEIDTVVRKGKNEVGKDTFFVQAGGTRSASLTGGFPVSREDLFAYDAVVIANLEGDFFTQAQLAALADFTGERGGGLLVLGTRSFAQRGLVGTALEAVLPVELDDRQVASTRATFGAAPFGPENRLVVTPDGLQHAVMRIGSTEEETRSRWAAVPPLAGAAPLGGPRAGATVLAVAATASGVYPVVAVQRFGRGRSMVFGGEGAWRWRMMLPAADRTFEFFWRQAVRWLAGGAPDQVTLTVPGDIEPGDPVAITVEARDVQFRPVSDAVIDLVVTAPGGDAKTVIVQPDGRRSGRFTAAIEVETPGLYRIRVEARRGATRLGAADRWFQVGRGNREFADPRLNEGVLRRIAAVSGGRYVRAADASKVASWLEEIGPAPVDAERRDVWNQPWAYAMLIGLLSIEWVCRRRWGLR